METNIDDVVGVSCRLGHCVSVMFQVGVRAEASQMDEGRRIIGARTTSRLYSKSKTLTLFPCSYLCQCTIG